MGASDQGDIHRPLERGLALFNARFYFDAHEIWEDWWRDTSLPEKQIVQGLIQAAVAMHHYSTGNRAGALSVMERALRNFGNGKVFCGLDLERLRADMKCAIEQLRGGDVVEEFSIACVQSGGR